MAQSIPSNQEARSMVDRFFEATDLRAPGSPPFHLVAHVRYDVGDKSVDGMYELLWASPDRYRETFKMAGMAEVDVALETRIYIFRNTSSVPLPLWDLRPVLEHPFPKEFAKSTEVTNVSTKEIDGEQRTCIQLATIMSGKDTHTFDDDVCFDPKTNDITSFNRSGNPELYSGNIQLKSFKSIGDKRYPWSISRVVRPATIEVKIDTLENVQKFADDVFAPPPEAIERAWCASPTSSRNGTYSSQPMFTQGEIKNMGSYFIIVGPDGRVKKFVALGSFDPKSKDKIESWLKSANFPIHLCGKQSIEYETFYTPAVRMNF